MTYRVMVRCGASEATRLRRRTAEQAARITADVRAGYPTWRVLCEPSDQEQQRQEGQ